MKYGDLTLGQIEALVNILGGESVVLAILQGQVKVVPEKIIITSETFTVLVDYTLNLTEDLLESEFDSVSLMGDFSGPYSDTKTQHIMTLFHFGKKLLSEEVIAEMNAKGYRPATILELVAFARVNPNLQRQFQIAALGSVKENYAPYLHKISMRRTLRKRWIIEKKWCASSRFLAVRK